MSIVDRHSLLPQWGHRLVRWVPAIVGYVATLVMFVAFNTPLLSVFLYSLYLLVFAAIPGTLLWRMLRTNPKSFLEEVAAGTTLGLCVQTLLTWLLTPFGVPRLAAVWIVIVVGLCIVRPRLRSLWRSQADAAETPAWMGWALSAFSVLACWWVVNNDWRNHTISQIPGMPGQWYAVAPQEDMNFQQAISAMVLHGGTTFPNVAAIPLKYELMVSYHIADAARWTGIDLTVLVLRLATIPLLILAVLLCAALAHRITKSSVGAVLGAGFAYFTNPPPLWAGTHYPLIQVASLNLGVYRSPTQTFAQPIFHLLLLLAIVIISRKRVSLPQLSAFVLIAFVAGGAKATLLPQTICALIAALAVGWIIRARKSGRILFLLGAVAVLFLATLYLILGTGARGLVPSLDVTATHWTAFASLLHPAFAIHLSPFKAAFLAVGWSLGVIAALVAIIVKRKDLGVWMLAGVGLSGFGGSLLTAHPTLSQIWFLRGAWPLLGILAGIGVFEAAKALHVNRRVGVAVVPVSLVLGLGAAVAVRHSFHIPIAYEYQKTWADLFAPYAVLISLSLLIGAIAVLVIVLFAKRRRAPLSGLVIVGLLVSVVALQGSSATELAVQGLLPMSQTSWFPKTDADGAYAARWVRDHSQVDDTIVTNMHCLGTAQPPFSAQPPVKAEPPVDAYCSNARHFWLGALSERQVLLEGWDYAPAPQDVAPDWDSAPAGTRFWDPAFLAQNDGALSSPSPTTMNWLREHSVDWIVVDRSVSRESSRLKNYADLVLVKGHFAVYRVDSNAAGG
ncbi:hypothetical protein [Humibacter sp. RRB41]|uniref:hypothetical protein n=1 Tax=Humibacter sp. RRB41 TaxID=2919946 RepID=UPI001FAA6DD1|nr:hypothetical protein [Humibacter sp. RRB41]